VVLVQSPSERTNPLIMVCGKYGCGKTTAARALKQELEGFHLIGIDEVRQEMGFVPYSQSDNPAILAQMDLLVARALCEGAGVIVERPHQTYESRGRSYNAAIPRGHPVVLVECVCPESIARGRIASRPEPDGKTHTHSNDPRITERIRRNWEDVSRDFIRIPELLQLVGYIRYLTHVPEIIRVNVPEKIEPLISQVCGILGCIKPAGPSAVGKENA
jgi:predicted kinase